MQTHSKDASAPRLHTSFPQDETFWYVVRAHQKEEQAEAALSGEGGLPFFIAKHAVIRQRNGKKIRASVPLIPGLLFVHASRLEINQLKLRYPFLLYAMTRSSEGLEFLVVPEAEMESFIRVASATQHDVRYYRPGEIDLKKGQHVKVHGGPFDGAEGYFVSVKGRRSRQFVVEIAEVATASVQLGTDSYLEVL